jgi:CHASE2 domain-containing sensor protein/serine phosphatase RsbU (regulator of sigma subunit)
MFSLINKKILILYILLVIFILIGHYSFYKSDIAKILDYKTYDIVTELLDTSSNKSKNSNVIIVDIDEKSLDVLGQWPWPRIILSQVLQNTNTLYPSAIGIDIIFSEKDRTSPKEINLFYKNFFGIDNSFYGIPKEFQDNDLIFSSALQDTKSTLGIYLSQNNIHNKKCNQLNSLELDTKDFQLESYDHILCSTPSLKSGAKYSGFVNAFLDEDATLRRMPLLRKYNDLVLPSLSIATLLSIKDNIKISNNGTISVLNHKVQTDQKSNILLNFYHNEWYKKVSVIDLLNNRIPQSMIMGKIVLIGSSAISLHDKIVVTGAKEIIGVKVHATMIDNILNNEYLIQPSFYKWLNVLVSLFLNLLIFFLLSRRYKKSVIFVFTSIIISLTLITFFTFKAGIYISVAYFIVPFLAYMFLITIIHIIIDTYDKHLLKEELTKKHIAELDGKIKERTAQLVQSHKHIQDNINYAAIIQGAILPQEDILSKYTDESFIFWKPKDVVGGDIYFVSELSSKDEILVMLIDGAGHGVSGAFVTMLVKAIETQILAEIENSKMQPSPALILEYFNKSIKVMLKQDKSSKSNAGFDGGVLYYNKKTNLCKYAGAKTPLYIVDDNEIKIIQSDRKNVGYIRTKIDQKYTEYDIDLKENTKLYLSTDGFYDQEGLNNTRYSKKKFQELIKKIKNKSFLEQKNDIMSTLKNFQSTTVQSDDIAVIGLKFKTKVIP